MFSQNDEEDYILKYFGGQIGKFLDIGAFNGKTFSNTYALVELGWSGVCVEPSPSVFLDLMKLHKDNPRITMLAAAIDSKAGIAPFYDSSGDAISTFDVAHRDKWKNGYGSKFTKIYVPTIPVVDIFKTFGYDFDFINIDVECMNYPIFVALPMSQMKVRMMCVEHDNHEAEIQNRFTQYGFKKIMSNSENIIFAK